MFNAKNRKLAMSRNRLREQVLVCNLRAMKSSKDTHFNWHRHRQEEERKLQEEERVRKEDR